MRFPACRGFPAALLASVPMAVLGACIAAVASPPTPVDETESSPASFIGTWTGASTCVGDRPACRDETVVYRFIGIDGHPDRIRLLADKILDEVRVPMGALVFEHDRGTGKLRCEFETGRTHGVWTFAMAGDVMTGSLVILPERSVGREVKVHRVKDGELPPAPPIGEYGE